MNIMDYAGSIWITAFNEVAEQIMTINANDLQKTKVGSLTSRCKADDVSRTKARTTNSHRTSKKRPGRHSPSK